MEKRRKTVIRSVLEEELERNNRMKKRYEDELQELPKGSIQLREIGKQEYYYLKFREENEVVSKYLGNKNNTIIDTLEEQIKKRKYLEGVIRDLNQEEKEIRKALK